jgi:hypothetical protein
MDIKIGEREIPMLMTVAEMAEIQEEIGCTVGQLRDEVFGIEINFDAEKEEDQIHFGIVEDGKKIRKFAKLIRILGNAGLEEAGKEPDLTDKWILRHMKPGMLMAYVVGVTAIINAAMQIETAEEKQNAPVDEVLEEENRKKEPET